MPYELFYDSDNGIVSIRIRGLLSRREHVEVRDGGFRLCYENRCWRILLDLREIDLGGFSTVEFYDFGQSVAAALPGVRVAHVMPRDNEAKKDVRFISTVEANRGVSTAEFESVERAREWLLAPGADTRKAAAPGS